MIRLDKITKSFARREVLNCPALQFEHDLVHGIIGLNGAGKTTFFNILAGFLPPDKGTLWDDGNKLSRREVVYLETVNYFYSNITGEEYLSIFPATNRDFHTERMTELMHLPLREIIETYSTGMKKKLALLATLKQNKPIYLFDEPFNGLDLETNEVLKLIIQRLQRKKKTIFISSHILSPLTDLCDKIHLLQSGVFTKVYERTVFDTIGPDLFAGFDTNVRQILDSSL